MGAVLTAGSTLACGHGATGSATGNSKLKVSGSTVLTSAGTSSWSFILANCTQKPTQAQPNNIQCSKLLSQNGGKSQKLTVGGSPVILESIAGDTNGKPKSDVMCKAGQSKLTAS
jgi:hypothetical protein